MNNGLLNLWMEPVVVVVVVVIIVVVVVGRVEMKE
jgi:cytochrome c-type biogenesis protein CcmH/NrfF